jgi:hypothetical protein
MGYADSNRGRLVVAESHPMTPILATVLNVDKRGNEYVVTVQLGNEDFSGPFERLSFENKPDTGWIHYGWLDLIYHRDPDLRAGQKFPLWSASAT